MHRLLYVITFMLMFIVSCSSSKDSNKISMNSSPTTAPGYCRIKGTIIKIDSTLETNNNSPCSKLPCTALVRIDSVLGYGAGFGSINAGTEINLKFAFTLGPSTKELFPNMTDRLPGLTINSQFIADIKHNNVLNTNESKNMKTYLVYGYKKL